MGGSIGKGAVQFLDIQPQLKWIIGPELHPESRRNPWKDSCPTLVGSGKILIRHFDALGKAAVRILEAFEYFRLVGWGDADWARVDDGHKIEFLELCAKLAGNALSLFQYGPVQLALMATYGRYCLSGIPREAREAEHTAAGQSESESATASEGESDSD